jgi:hypothetical protein
MGESHMIKSNMQWEQTRYLAAMVYNVNCNKKAQMITPDKLFPLPQDVYLAKGKPKSTKEQYLKFKKRLDKLEAKKKSG